MITLRRFITLTCLLAVGCAGDVSAQRGDAAVWGGARAPWSRPDAGTPLAFVANSRGNSLTVLDLFARRALATLPVPVVPLTENGPADLAVDPARGVLYAPLSLPPPRFMTGPHGDHLAAPVSGLLIKRDLFTMRLLGRLELEHNPARMVLSRDRRRAYVSHYDEARARAYMDERAGQLSNVLEVDLDAMTVTRRIPACVIAQGMCLSADDRTLYVACTGDDALAVIDLATPSTPRLVPLVDGAPPAGGAPMLAPYWLSLSPNGGRLWAGLRADADLPLRAFDTARGTWDAQRAVGRLPGAPQRVGYLTDGTTVLVPTQGPDGLVVLRDGAPPRVERAMMFDEATCARPSQIARGPDGLLYLVCAGLWSAERVAVGAVLALDPGDLHTVARYDVGFAPSAIAFDRGAP